MNNPTEKKVSPPNIWTLDLWFIGPPQACSSSGREVGVESGGIVLGYNFTEQVRKILAFARQEADRLRHEYVGTEHILLGILGAGEGTAVAVLRNLGVSSNGIRRKIEETVTMGRADSRTRSDLPYTSRAKKVLEFSMDEARNLGHDYVGAEHLLLGVLREEKGIAAQVLVDAGLTEGTARTEVRRILKSGGDLPVKLSATGIAGVAVEVRLANRSVVREDFRTVEEAIAFLKQQ